MDRASSILTLAIGLPPDRRSALLAAACGDDEDLRRDVERMLDANPDDATAVFVPENGDTSRQGGSDTQRGRLQVRCPNCHAPMEVAVDSDLTDLTCGVNGSRKSERLAEPSGI